MFNLIPIPPLDGSKILMVFLPNRTIYKIQRYEHIITLILFIAIMMGGVTLFISPIQNWLYDRINDLTQLAYSWSW